MMEKYIGQDDGSIVYQTKNQSKRYVPTKVFSSVSGRSASWAAQKAREGFLDSITVNRKLYIYEEDAKKQREADQTKKVGREKIEERIATLMIEKKSAKKDHDSRSLVERGLVMSQHMPEMDPEKAVEYIFSVDIEAGKIARDYLLGTMPTKKDTQLVSLLASDLQEDWGDVSLKGEFLRVLKKLQQEKSKVHHHNMLLGTRDVLGSPSKETQRTTALKRLLEKYDKMNGAGDYT